jgi:hypothetical protein
MSNPAELASSEMVNPENAETILDQAEKRLGGVLADAAMLDGRRTTVAMVYLAVLSALAGVGVQQMENPDLPVLAGTGAAFLFLLRSAQQFYVDVLRHGDYQLPGLDPNCLLRRDLVALENHRFRVLISKTYQDLIAANAETNRKWGVGINKAVVNLLAVPAIFLGGTVLGHVVVFVCSLL